jgi:malate synthase
LAETAAIRKSEWAVAPIPHDLLDRRVEITGPVDRKMIINGLNSGANVFMADFEDAHAPTWNNTVDGQVNLHDAVRRTITFSNPQGKHYKLESLFATLMVRPRGWHLPEKHVTVEGAPISGALFDCGLFLYHNAKEQVAYGTGPYFYLPKLENHLEARLWNDVFVFAQDYLDIPQGTIRATVLIENVLAAFEMDEILWELRDHSAGLNCGRWDYIFSFIKKFRADPAFVLPDRALITMDRHFLASYVDLLINTCHRRGIHAMGGMAAQIPIRTDAEANELAIAKVREDKEREVRAGHDGTWVAHPGLVSVAKDVFDAHMPGANQIAPPADVAVTADDLLAVPDGPVTAAGVRHNIDVGIQYLAAWLRGVGCVPLYNLMEDAATAEISRTQLWQWIHHGTTMDDGRVVTAEFVHATVDLVLDNVCDRLGEQAFNDGRFAEAATVFRSLTDNEQLEDWLTLLAYEHL